MSIGKWPNETFAAWANKPHTEQERVTASELYAVWSRIGGDVLSAPDDLTSVKVDLTRVKVEGTVDFILLARAALGAT
jgi:hypothetical protein